MQEHMHYTASSNLLNIERKVLFIGLLVGLAHILSGVAVLIDPAALNVTALSGLHQISEWFDLGHRWAAWLLLAAGSTAILGAVKWHHWIFFIPQQLLLLLMIGTITIAITTGQYPDGYIPTGRGWFIEADQAWAWILGISHSIWLTAYLYGNNKK